MDDQILFEGAKHAAKLFANRSISASVVSQEVTKRASFFA